MLFSLIKHYLDLYISDPAESFHIFCTVSLLLYFMVLKTISPGCGVRASLMLFLALAHIIKESSTQQDHGTKSFEKNHLTIQSFLQLNEKKDEISHFHLCSLILICAKSKRFIKIYLMQLSWVELQLEFAAVNKK